MEDGPPSHPKFHLSSVVKIHRAFAYCKEAIADEIIDEYMGSLIVDHKKEMTTSGSHHTPSNQR